MNENEILQLFQQIGVLKKGHFRLSSGKHSDTYLQCAILQQHPVWHEKAIQSLADKLKGIRPTVIVGAAVGGIISAYELARSCQARCIFAERVDGMLKFRRGFELYPEDQPVLIEDVITTAKTTLELISLVKSYQIEPLAITSLVDRQIQASTSFPYPFFSLIKIQAVLFDELDCPLCKDKIPLTDPGSRRLHSAP